MSNPQVVIGGAAVNVPMTTAGLPPGATDHPSPSGSWEVFDASGAVMGGNTAPGSGSPRTDGTFTMNFTGSSVTIGGKTYPVLAVQALAGTTPGTYSLVQNDALTGTNVYAFFDVATSGGGAGRDYPRGIFFDALIHNADGTWTVKMHWRPVYDARVVGYRLYQQDGMDGDPDGATYPFVQVYEGTEMQYTAEVPSGVTRVDPDGRVDTLHYSWAPAAYDADGNEGRMPGGICFNPPNVPPGQGSRYYPYY